MTTAILTATPRTAIGTGAARKLRRTEQVPGVIYGHHRDPQPLAINLRELERLLQHVGSEATVVELQMDGTSSRTLIREIQRHPFKRDILHVDFQELVAGESITVDIPIVLTGTPQGVRLGGTLDLVLRELTVEVDPANIPNHVELDVTALDLNDSLHVSDIVLPEGVTVIDDPDATVCVVAPPRVEAEEAPAEAAPETGEAPTEPELIRKAKEEAGEA
ncbi:MAG TPA: 50S ribosomal protein L25/general stress protein Ctc [Gemmatimonadaceae bacterium]|nr:50S ribosomal protein L25/general stress protein Ctc [Gemmatimonadaceae bacterium]